MHKHSNTTNVLTTEKVFWKLSNAILHVIYRLQFFQRPQSQFTILKIPLIYFKRPLASILFSQEPIHTPVNQVLGSWTTLPLWSCNSSKFTPFCSLKKTQRFHFTLFVGVSDSVDCLPSVHASRVLFSASVFCWSTTT